MFYSHGTNRSKGVLILVSDKLQFELKSVNQDSEGRYVLIEALIQESRFLLLNIYSPNKTSEQCTFFANILSILDGTDFHSQTQVIIGGDFNVHLDAEMDNEGGRVEKKDSVKNISDKKLEYDLVDIWRIRNPDKRQFTWRQKRPRVQRRLDYWLISDCLQDFIEHADIIPSIKSDHSAITLQINTIEDKVRGPSHWVFNSSLLEDDTYIDLICSSLKVWLKEFEDIHDKQLLWDLVKYKIRQTTISFSKEKAKERRNRKTKDVVESKLKESEQLCAIHPTEENIESLKKYKTEYDSMYDYITQGNIIRSKAAW
ncbi:hypothetical protein ACROYT_G012410 [Oculina patagonica]